MKFKVDYNDVSPRFKGIETEQDEKKLSAAENKTALLHPARIKEISRYILRNFKTKTHRNQGSNKGFNAMFAVNSVDAAKCYYEELNRLQKGSEKPLKIATVFSFAANEEQHAIGEIARDLEKATIDAITLFGDSNTKNVVLEKSYKEYLEDFTDIATGEARRGYTEVVKELKAKFPDPDAIVTEKDKKEFSKLFGEYLRIENILQNYDEFTNLKAFQAIDRNDPEAVEAFKEAYFVTDEDIAAMQEIEIRPDRVIQDYRSAYNDIRDWLRRERSGRIYH